VNFTCASRPEELEPVLPHMEAVAQKTYQRGLGVGFENSPEVLARLRLFAQKGWLRVYILYIEGVPCSFWTGSVYEGVFLSEYMGYDPALHEHSVGTVTIINTLEALCERGIQEVDFGIGPADYKERFANRRLMEHSARIFAPTLKGATLNAFYTVAGFADSGIRSVLEKTRLLPKLKKMWRQRASAQARLSVPAGPTVE
jgi:CelD/BcsL family acetyltransferase involved in cellulose biosynthesis